MLARVTESPWKGSIEEASDFSSSFFVLLACGPCVCALFESVGMRWDKLQSSQRINAPGPDGAELTDIALPSNDHQQVVRTVWHSIQARTPLRERPSELNSDALADVDTVFKASNFHGGLLLRDLTVLLFFVGVLDVTSSSFSTFDSTLV